MTNDPPNKEPQQPQGARTKSKPKFDIPAEDALPPSGWVYREEEGPKQALVPAPPAPSPAASAAAAAQAGPFITLPMGMFAFGLGIMGRLLFSTAKLMTLPMAVTRRLFLSN